MTKKQKQAIVAVDLGNAAFYQWFIAQYGQRPSKRSMNNLVEELGDLTYRTLKLQQEIGFVEAWERNRDAALKAWQAREDQKK